MSRWRALSLVLVHVLMIVHVVQWLATGRTLSPVEPSEAMYALNNGYVNAGFIFFVAAILATLVFGRFFCGWGCHVVAYQDFCAWLLKKIRIKPRPLRSRVLVFAPLALAVYMFVWPTAYRIFRGEPAPRPTNHLVTTDFWATFPGPTIAVLTILTCGFAIVYFLGAKGFCTYGCPYGGFFGLADKFALGRIFVTEDCEHCGHCTAVCSSNVRVHEEVAKYGMVVNPGCMKCMDCVSVCPNDALYFGFGRPKLVNGSVLTGLPAPEASDSRVMAESVGRKFDFTLGEELIFAGIGLLGLLAFRGLYGQIPLLMAMGMGAIFAFVVMKLSAITRDANVRLQNLVLKRGGAMTGWGRGFVLLGILLVTFAAHSGFVQACATLGHVRLTRLNLPDSVWFAGNRWWEEAPGSSREDLIEAATLLEWSHRGGLLPTPAVVQDLVWVYLAKGEDGRAEVLLRRLIESTPRQASLHRGLAGVLRKQGRIAQAEQSYRDALRLDADFLSARLELAAMLAENGRRDQAISALREGLERSPTDIRLTKELVRLLAAAGRVDEARSELARAIESLKRDSFKAEAGVALADFAVLEIELGQADGGIQHLQEALSLDPSLHGARYNLALALLQQSQIPQAIEHLEKVVSGKPDFAEAHYNLGVAKFMSGKPQGAIPHVQKSLSLNPRDIQAHEFLAVVYQTLGEADDAQREIEAAAELRKGRPTAVSPPGRQGEP